MRKFQAKESLVSQFKVHEEKIRYLVAGGWNTVFGYGTFAAMFFFWGDYIHYMAIMIISYIVSVSNAYISYKFFVFKTKGNYLREYLRFYLVYGFAFILNIVLLPVSVEVFKINPLISQAAIVMVTVVFSYLGHKNYSFDVSQDNDVAHKEKLP